MPHRAWRDRRDRQYTRIKPAPLERGLRAARGTDSRTREELYNEARDLHIEGRSMMTKAELARAVSR
jgi:hypothetical protein